MQRINILFVMLQMEMGGAERLICNLALKFDRKLFNPSVAWFYGDKILREFEELDVPLYHVPKVKRIDFHTMQKIGEIIFRNNIHVVNAHHFMPMVYSFYGSKIKNRARFVYTEHSEWEIDAVSWKWKKVGRYLMNHADAAVGVSLPVSKKIQENFKTSHAKTFTIQNGVNLETFSNNHDKRTAKKKIGLSPADQVIGVVANFRRVKNHLFLLKAFAELAANNDNLKLLLIGQGFEFDPENSEQEIRDFIRDKGLGKNVLLLGFRQDISDLLNAMDIFCLTSFKEGLPISLIEAMAAGLPVIGTDVDGIRDVILPKRNGFLIAPDDVTSLKNVLLTLLHDASLMHAMGQESRSLAKDIYSLDGCINKYQELFLSF